MPRMSAADKAAHLESAPRKFARRTLEPASREKSRRARDRALKAAESMTKADAVAVAQTLLVHVFADGIDYEDFQSAQAVERHVGRAISELRGLALS